MAIRITYGEYDQRVNRFANALANLGIGQGEVVSFITYNSHQLLEAYYAVPQIEGILNPVNIRLSHHEIEYILNHAETKVLCFHQDFLPLVKSIRHQLPKVQHYIILEPDNQPEWAFDYETLLKEASPEAEIDLDGVDEDAVIELFYTSGTTGPPKGVHDCYSRFQSQRSRYLAARCPFVPCQWLGFTAVLDRSWGQACHAAHG
jgi:fatty-acyl-CoA synthase